MMMIEMTMRSSISVNAALSSFVIRHLLLISTSSFVPETGIARNRNCPACKSLRKSGASLADARRFSEIAHDADRSRKAASQRFQDDDSINAPATSHIPARDRHLPPSKTEKEHSPEYPRFAIHR